MSSETILQDEQTVAKAASAAPAKTLNMVLENVRRDSQTDTQVYLEESKVPHGGE